MSTLVCFHAHPDDEAISTGGSMARAANEGHRVVLVIATNGEHGETPDDLGDDETLADRRRAETDASAAALGAHRVVWLGYRDSGMTGWDENDHPDSFHLADVDEAAERLAAVLREESADLLTTYDWHGVYGHPDHIKVYEVGAAAAALAGVRVIEATANRDVIVERMRTAMAEGTMPSPPDGEAFDPGGPADDGNPFGTPEHELTLRVDVRDFVTQKRAALACHRSQISDQSFFLEMSDEQFADVFGTEWFIEPDRSPPVREGWFFGDGAS